MFLEVSMTGRVDIFYHPSFLRSQERENIARAAKPAEEWLGGKFPVYHEPMQQTIQVLPDVPAIVRRAAELISQHIKASIAERGRATIALSGGKSVANLLGLLAADTTIEWPRVFLFWGDDRFVEPSNPHSNFKLTEEALLKKVPTLPRKNVFPIPASASTPCAGAKAYSQTIRDFFGVKEGEWPRFDIAINGMGPDGHTASLFPHSTALDAADDIAAMNHAGLAPWVDRVTLTFPVFNHARCVLFMASGAAKAQTLKAVLEGERNIHEHPAQGIQPIDGDLIWLLDPAIAAGLKR
jgi:6-phosphogluconolactonase